MKKLFLLLAFVGVLPLSALAQDDVYFTPTKSVSKSSSDNAPAYYSGSNRSVDEYNRRGRLKSYYQKIGTDSYGNDIVTFQRMSGVSPDSTYIDTAYIYPGSARYEDDYAYTRRMSRWDGFYDPWFYGAYRWGPMELIGRHVGDGIILGIMAIAAGMVGDTHIMDTVGVIPIIIVTDIMLVARVAQQVGVVGEVQVQTENIQQEAV